VSAVIIDGFEIARNLRSLTAVQAQESRARGAAPCLAVILAGDNPASATYVASKEKALAECGMESRDIRLSAEVPEAEILEIIAALNVDATVHGILVQLPLPSHIDAAHILEAVLPSQDVDGFHPQNMGRLLSLGEASPGFLPCTPRGVLHLLDAAGISCKGKHAVIVGRSNIVGKPMAALLSNPSRNATVTICHTATASLAAHTRQADILIVAAGSPGLISGAMVKSGAAVIDVGTTRVPDASRPRGYRISGDVDFEAVKETAGWITPVPGGVGPMTIAMLIRNTLDAARSDLPARLGY
jgi:methylenetetrahydrofolate dehydrogenase (NADP+)/methenyltetrahydrofolate cyclohydrolase